MARLAQAAALATPGVVALHPGPTGMLVTGSGEERVDGVLVVAAPGERWTIDVGLVAALVPLPALIERVRARIVRALAADGLADRLDEVGVAVHDLEEPRVA